MKCKIVSASTVIQLEKDLNTFLIFLEQEHCEVVLIHHYPYSEAKGLYSVAIYYTTLEENSMADSNTTLLN